MKHTYYLIPSDKDTDIIEIKSVSRVAAEAQAKKKYKDAFDGKMHSALFLKNAVKVATYVLWKGKYCLVLSSEDPVKLSTGKDTISVDKNSFYRNCSPREIDEAIMEKNSLFVRRKMMITAESLIVDIVGLIGCNLVARTEHGSLREIRLDELQMLDENGKPVFLYIGNDSYPNMNIEKVPVLYVEGTPRARLFHLSNRGFSDGVHIIREVAESQYPDKTVRKISNTVMCLKNRGLCFFADKEMFSASVRKTLEMRKKEIEKCMQDLQKELASISELFESDFLN